MSFERGEPTVKLPTPSIVADNGWSQMKAADLRATFQSEHGNAESLSPSVHLAQFDLIGGGASAILHVRRPVLKPSPGPSPSADKPVDQPASQGDKKSGQ